jgi:hypothetical protein
VQLAFMALHRVAVNKDPDSTGYTWYMVSASSVYGVIMIALFVRVVLAPAVTDALAKRKQLQEDQYSADAAAYRGAVGPRAYPAETPALVASAGINEGGGGSGGTSEPFADDIPVAEDAQPSNEPDA